MRPQQTQFILRHAGVELVSVTLPPGQYVIGRNRDIDIRVDTPLLSRRHARITMDGDRILIEDLGSSNGTYIDNRPVTKITRVPPGKAVRLGDVDLEINQRGPVGGVAPGGPAAPSPSPPQPRADAPAKPPVAPRKSPRRSRKSRMGRRVGIGVGVLALGVAAFLLRPKEETSTEAERYHRTHEQSPGPDGAKATPTPHESEPAHPDATASIAPLIEKLRQALLAARVEGLKSSALTVSRSGKIAADLTNSSISDLSILAGYPVDELTLGGSRVTKLEPLRDLPLARLRFDFTGVTDVRPLVGIATLEDVVLGKSVTNLEDLRAAHSIKRISYDVTYQGDFSFPDQTAAEFWKTYDGQKEQRAPAIAALQKMGVKDVTEQRLTINKAGKLEINLAGQPVTDLTPLAGLAVVRLDIGATKVSDLSPLRGMPLQALSIRACPVSDLSPLQGGHLTELIIGVRDWRKPNEAKTKVSDLSAVRGMPLNKIALDGAVDPDLSPLAECPSLRVVTLPLDARNVEVLRKLPNLKRISWGWPGGDDKMSAPGAFWKEYDAKNKKSTPPLAATKPGAPAATPARVKAPAEDVAADEKVFAEAKQKRAELLAKFQFNEAHAAILDPALKTEDARDDQEQLGKKAQWLANFKAQLIEDLNKEGYAAPLATKAGAALPGGVEKADEQQVMLHGAHGEVPVPWTGLSPESIFTMGSSFVRPDMPKEIAAFRKWQLGVFASFIGKKEESLALLQQAAKLKPIYKDELPIFQNATDSW